VAQFPRRHFHGQSVLVSEGLNVAASGNDGQFEFSGGFQGEAFVGIAGGGAQLVVEMGDGQFPAVSGSEAVKDMEQDHRIHSARNRDQDALAIAKKLLRLAAVFNMAWQISHGAIVQGFEGNVIAALRLAGGRGGGLNGRGDYLELI
jgi:hypothetical protein